MNLNQPVQCLISIAKNHVLDCFGIVFGQNQGELPAMLLLRGRDNQSYSILVSLCQVFAEHIQHSCMAHPNMSCNIHDPAVPKESRFTQRREGSRSQTKGCWASAIAEVCQVPCGGQVQREGHCSLEMSKGLQIWQRKPEHHDLVCSCAHFLSWCKARRLDLHH